jgi:hypothetical protein
MNAKGLTLQPIHQRTRRLRIAYGYAPSYWR